MTRKVLNYLSVLLAAMVGFISQPVIAADSYRYFHVTIDTPWAIFIFLLLIILFPFVLSAVLYWYFTFKKHKEQTEAESAATETTTEEQKTP
ncbi:MAG: hypothetical protein PVF34_02405 [Gammaproteobacteria bacterium]|jgi:phosphotransferase system  glucose/maltose/N-acetylglucosamine-specific IIC component